MKDFFRFRRLTIRYSVEKMGRYDLHQFGDPIMKAYEKNYYYSWISESNHTGFSLERAVMTTTLTNSGEKS